MPQHSIADARRHLSDLIDAATRGEDITITRNGWPVARLQPYQQSRPPIDGLLGAMKGRVTLLEKHQNSDQEGGDARDAGA